MKKNKLLGMDKLKSMYKKRRVHGQKYCLLKYYRFFFFSSAQMLAILPLFLIHKDTFKIINFLKITEEKKLLRDCFK